ncbi:MAG TPA: divalent-cation tolerance protein CutA [Usitatibacteraceae bacterium]|nr:divalent-cation tolerance protein CutA [Usitatibacteraceae bacterium]
MVNSTDQARQPPTVLVVICTVPDAELGVKIAESLLQHRLAACVHRLPPGVSTYRWQGRVETGEESTLIIKTESSRFAELAAEIRRLHPYDVPEILALRVTDALPAYLQWVAGETGG